MDPIIIIGSGIAGYTLAREFRKLNKDHELVIITRDDGRSYPKPMLSNALAKAKSADDIAMADAEKMAMTLPATILTEQTVVSIDADNRSLVLASGESLNYDKLVLAVGAQPVRLSFEGDAADVALSVNDLQDYTVFRDKLSAAKRVAIIGSGLIGCEFANDLLHADVEISLIGLGSLPMDTLLPEAMATELHSTLADAGVNWHLGTTVTTINHADDAYELLLTSGQTLQADLVVSAVGLRADLSLAKLADLSCKRGIETDQFLQTSDPNIFALGDCAEVSGHHLLYIAPITSGAKALAKTLNGEPTQVSYPAMPVTIKTPIYPLVSCPPAVGISGSWVVEPGDTDFGMKAFYVDDEGTTQGFVLSGDMVKQKLAYAKQVPALLA